MLRTNGNQNVDIGSYGPQANGNAGDFSPTPNGPPGPNGKPTKTEPDVGLAVGIGDWSSIGSATLNMFGHSVRDKGGKLQKTGGVTKFSETTDPKYPYEWTCQTLQVKPIRVGKQLKHLCCFSGVITEGKLSTGPAPSGAGN